MIDGKEDFDREQTHNAEEDHSEWLWGDGRHGDRQLCVQCMVRDVQ